MKKSLLSKSAFICMLGLSIFMSSCEELEGAAGPAEKEEEEENNSDNEDPMDNVIGTHNLWRQTGYEYHRAYDSEYDVIKDRLEGEEFWEINETGGCRMGLDKVEYCKYTFTDGEDGNKYLNITEEHLGKTIVYAYRVIKMTDTELTLYIDNRLEDGGSPQDEIEYSATRTFVHAGDSDFNELRENIEYKAVDLGLSVDWAETNLSTSVPEEIGGYFSWTEAPKIIEEEMGEGWRMPTIEEFRELYTKCAQSLVNKDGKLYIKYTSENGNSIILPFGGYFEENDYNGLNRVGRYWSGDLPSEGYVDHLEVSEDSYNPGMATSSDTDKKLTYKMTIRAVKEK